MPFLDSTTARGCIDLTSLNYVRSTPDPPLSPRKPPPARKPAPGVFYEFQVVTPNRVYELAATSPELREYWV